MTNKKSSLDLLEKDPIAAEIIAQIRAEFGDVPIDELLKAWEDIPVSERDREIMKAYGEEVRRLPVSVEGYELFLWCVSRKKLDKCQIPFIKELLKAYNKREEKFKKGVIVKGWRGIGKSLILVTWVAYVQGKNPVGNTALIRINDGAAQQAGNGIATMIEHNPGWAACFPNVVPDKQASWSAKAGFCVIDNSISYSEWQKLIFADHTTQPSLMCAGLESGLIIGIHPTNGEYFDDMHNEKNTRSKTEMKGVIDTLDGDIIPTWTTQAGRPLVASICTPWDEEDGNQRLLATGIFTEVRIPIFMRPEEVESHPYAEVWRGGKIERFSRMGWDVILTWPEAFPMEVVEQLFDQNPKRFAQMYLLDLSLMKTLAVYKYYSMEYGQIRKLEWPMDAGIDPVYSDKKEGGTSHFAMLFGLRIPLGGVVVSGGVLEKCSASDGMGYVVQTQRTYPNFGRSWCETYGGGALFVQMVQQNPGARINPIESKELPDKKKGDRQYTFLQPLLASGFFYISDEDTPVLNVLRNYLNRYPNITDPLAPEWDVADALVALLYGYFDVRARAVNSAVDATAAQRILLQRGRAGSLRPPKIAWNEWRG